MRAFCSVLIGVCLTQTSFAQGDTASLAGKVKDITGAVIAGTLAELRSETTPASVFRTSADSNGVYGFSGLPADEYTLKLSMAGFKSLTVKIHISAGEQKRLPILQLAIGSVADCGGHAVLDYVRFLPSGDHLGNLGGSVRLDRGPMVGKSPPIPDADVTLICSTGKVCGRTKTDSKGEFIFKALPSGSMSIRVSRPGFYPLRHPDFTVDDGLESIYHSIYIERCRWGNCDPMLRPKKPIGFCE